MRRISIMFLPQLDRAKPLIFRNLPPTFSPPTISQPPSSCSSYFSLPPSSSLASHSSSIFLSKQFHHHSPFASFPLYSTLSSSHSIVQPFPKRFISRSAILEHQHSEIDPNAADVNVCFVLSDGVRIPVVGKVGQSLLELAHNNDVELEGACEGSLACSTCHVILPSFYYEKLSDPSDEENDMLDMAYGLCETSRLGCQIKLTEELEGMDIQIPAATRNIMFKENTGTGTGTGTEKGKEKQTT